jgi:hypothetical protein
VLSELIAGTDLRTLLVVTEDWGSRDLAAGGLSATSTSHGLEGSLLTALIPKRGRIYCWAQSSLLIGDRT